MRRREFITLLSGATAWPLVARAQQPEQMPVIGFMSARSPQDSAHLVAAFRQSMSEGGFVEGRNVAIAWPCLWRSAGCLRTRRPFIWLDASADEGRSEKIMQKQRRCWLDRAPGLN
jgi:hypothetical protein